MLKTRVLRNKHPSARSLTYKFRLYSITGLHYSPTNVKYLDILMLKCLKKVYLFVIF